MPHRQITVPQAYYGYNPAGEITYENRSNDLYSWTGHANVDRSYTANGLNQYTAAGPASFAYDPNGNLQSDGTYYYTYDIENRLVLMNNGTTLRYDPLGRLYEVTKTGVGTTWFLHDGDALTAEYDGGGTMLRRHVHWGVAGVDDPLMWYEGSGPTQRRWLFTDRQGSIFAVNDGSNLVAANTYDEYGIPGSGNTGRFRYTGQAWLPELGMYYYKARMYSPTLGRFMQADPIGYGDGMNTYRYVGNDPVNAVDPTGLRCESHGGQKGDYCDPSHPGDDAPPIPVVALRQTVYIGGGGGINFGGLFITQPGVYAGGGIRLTVLEKPQNDRPPCDAVQRGGQALGEFAVGVGGGVSDVGLVVAGVGVGVATASGAALNPAGVLVGGALAVDGATATGVGGLITAGGATLMALSGSGKEAVKELATRVLTRRIPSGYVKDLVGKGVGMALDILPEIRSCR